MKQNPNIRFIFMLLLTLVLNGCSPKVGYFVTSIINPMPDYPVAMRDEYKSIYYTYVVGDEKLVDTFLFFIGGSGCSSYQYYLRQYFKALSENVKIFALQKRYIENRTTGLFGCPEQFKYSDYFSQWISDQNDFFDFILKQNRHPQRIVFMGVSEGANVAAVIASQHDEITHLIMLASGGGMEQADELAMLPDFQHIEFESAYKKIQNSPDSVEHTFLGHTYKYWSSVLWIDPLRYLLSSEKPTLVAMGEKDRMAPIKSAFKLKKEFEKAGKDNLTLILYKDGDHTFQNSDGKSFLPDLMRRISVWIQKESNKETEKGASLDGYFAARHSHQ